MSFIVNAENEYSDPGDLTCGVPHGDILGHLLFLRSILIIIYLIVSLFLTRFKIRTFSL